MHAGTAEWKECKCNTIVTDLRTCVIEYRDRTPCWGVTDLQPVEWQRQMGTQQLHRGRLRLDQGHLQERSSQHQASGEKHVLENPNTNTLFYFKLSLARLYYITTDLRSHFCLVVDLGVKEQGGEVICTKRLRYKVSG